MNLVPATPPTKPEQTWAGGDELASLFSRNLSLLDNNTPSALPPLTPRTASPTGVNYSISQHYIQPTAFNQPSEVKFQDASGSSSISPADQERSYLQYLLSSNLGSATSTSDLEIARAHGIIGDDVYGQALAAHARIVYEREQQAAESQLLRESQMYPPSQDSMALEEDCSAHSLLSVTGRQKADPDLRTAEFFNDYYGGVDSSYLDDDEYAPCAVYGACQLRPFDL